MAQTNKKPTILIVPGGASPTALYVDLVQKLISHGYETHVHDLRTCSESASGEPASLGDDAAFFHNKIEALVDAGKDVVVVAHSYGGLVATDAAHGLSRAERSGKTGGVVRIVYLSCIVGEVGATSAETCANLPKFEFMTPVDEKADFLRQVPDIAARITFSDVPFDEGLKWVSLMWPMSTRCFTNPIQHAAYLHSPVTWILCTKDEVLLPSFQRERIELIERESGRKVDVVELEVGHCPNVTATDATAKAIADSIERGA